MKYFKRLSLTLKGLTMYRHLRAPDAMSLPT